MADQIGAALRSGNSEKTFIDKLLGREDINALRDVITEDILDRKSIRKIKYLITSSESKLLNFDEHIYYLMNKYYLWIGELIKIYEMFLDYDEKVFKTKFESDPEYKDITDIMYSMKRRLSHVVKTSVDIYINISRTTMSKDALAFKEILTNKFDYSYNAPFGIPGMTSQQTQNHLVKGGQK